MSNKPRVRNGMRVIKNWWNEHTDQIPYEVFKRIDQYAIRRIDTQIGKGYIQGNLEYKVEGETYHCFWRLRPKQE